MRLGPNISGSITDWRSGETWEASRIAGQAAARSAMLRENGAKPGERVVIAHGGTPAFFADLFGVWQSGACAVCINPATTAAELETITEFVKPAAILDGSDIDELPENSDQSGLSGAELDDDALILFTSGTTGTPKGVVHCHRSLLARIALNQAHIPASALRKTLSVLPTHFGHGLIGNCLTALMGGHDLVLAPATNMEVPANLGAIIDTYGITFLSSVPTLWRKVTKGTERPEGDTLERVHVGSAQMSAVLWNDIAEWSGTKDVWNMYGITETANWIGGASLSRHEARDGLIGSMWGGAAAVISKDGDLRSSGEGEIAVQTPSLMTGYYRQPETTANVLKDGWYRTGDIGRIGDDGVMRLTGRESSAINRGGLKIYPEDIDLLLERHEAVREACAFAIEDEMEGETVGVAVALHNGTNIDAPSLRRWCAERISREKVPVKWVVVDEIPKTDRGKLNRAMVAECLKSEPAS